MTARIIEHVSEDSAGLAALDDADLNLSITDARRAESMAAGGGSIPAALLADLRRMGADVRPVVTAADLAATGSYRPTVAQRRFVTARDMTCCFPGCDRPAEYCDLDHTVAYDRSRLTHPGNLKSLCRKHFLVRNSMIAGRPVTKVSRSRHWLSTV
jgi:hypothetical protein